RYPDHDAADRCQKEQVARQGSEVGKASSPFSMFLTFNSLRYTARDGTHPAADARDSPIEKKIQVTLVSIASTPRVMIPHRLRRFDRSPRDDPRG
ncbi:MAG: hypothetical protein ACK523_21075, partial [Pirellulaceae bacterium]